ncbi:hypothetical protein HYPSUDRAFT_893779 [Hypholoma sublateritium FD-334 SS-4]|uniref:F-box domain-containing protein n=1 Tax=Hypholoma sublateritium (strain FD-334 SS-4) TaxID=945553 RepID=A0A0D2NRR2_HYPSF|nr:hypothetical protein HYPSUDRAFT_893779 [Hypholoma sublateritium FD-334 SS-4]
MSANQRLALTHALNDDVLSHIFEFNADMFSDCFALLTTRITSQVCPRWRALVLGMPSLWGKLIDIDKICDHRSDKWRNEIIRRSGAAPLWIRSIGDVSYERREDAQRFLRDLVATNIHRIQRLAALGPGHSYRPLYLTLPIMCVPAPLLESCEASFGFEMEDFDHDAPTAPLFANHAPMLSRLYLSRCRVNPGAPWLRHLYSITIGYGCSVRRALSVLSATHSLQELKMRHIHPLDVAETIPTVYLSRLKSLEFEGFARIGATLLGHIVLPADCSLTIRFPQHPGVTEEKEHLLSVIKVFTQHAPRAFQSLTFSHIHLIYDRKHDISFVCKQKGGMSGLLSIRIPLSGDSDANLLESFLKQLLTLDLTSVNALTFRANGRLNPCFGPFFGCLPSVTTLFVNLGTLSHIAHLQAKYISRMTKRPIIMFPALNVIDLSKRPIYYSRYGRNFYINQVTGAFFLLRLRAGHPISRLDMAELSPFRSHPNLDSLAEVKGLKVLYRLEAVKAPGIVEYTCGCDIQKNPYRIVYLLSTSPL